MKLRYVPVAALAVLAACPGQHVVVEAAIDEQPVAGLPVWLLPYDRVALLDSLAAAHDDPEPGIPPEWIERLDALAAEQATELEPDEQLERQAERTVLQARIDSVRAAHRAWERDVYAGFEEAVQQRLRETGRGEATDTTDARGRARIDAGEGRWWVWARYVLPTSVLEWNQPVVVRDDSAVVRLTRENAAEQPFF
jgi:hypothetical protein